MSIIQPHDSMGALWRAQDDAQRGSMNLADAMREQFLRFAIQHGVTLKDAQLLCLNPCRLKTWGRR